MADRRRFASRQHARLSRDRGAWTLTDVGSKNGLWLDDARRPSFVLALGLWLDDARRPSFVLAPGVEVGIGSLRLIAESRRMIAVRAFLSRILGWGEERRNQVDRALRSLREMATRRSLLVLLGEGDLVLVRRVSACGSALSPENQADVGAALQAAAWWNSLCMGEPAAE